LTESSLIPSRAARTAASAGPVRAWTPPERPLTPTGGGLQGLIRRLDAVIRRHEGIIEFSASTSCILRAVVTRAEIDMKLSDGAVISRGDPIIDVHFWNERLPQTSTAPGLAWGGRFGRQLVRSFVDLAVAMDADPRLRGAVAIRARLAFAGDRNRDAMHRFAHWFDFEGGEQTGPPPLPRRLHDAAEDVWLVLLTWTFNPGSLRSRRMVRRREDLWISKGKLVDRYAAHRSRRRC
jgi:hypothetical protein